MHYINISHVLLRKRINSWIIDFKVINKFLKMSNKEIQNLNSFFILKPQQNFIQFIIKGISG